MAQPAQEHLGLTSDEVQSRVAAGQVNAVRSRTSRSVATIVRSNVFTWFNLILGVLCALQLAFGSWRDALFGLVLVINTGIGIYQELRAKSTLDRLSLISAPKAHVIRDGKPAEIDVGAVVLDDVLELEPGGQIVVDGTVIESAGLEIDESLLTGESAPVDKRPSDSVMSGSFVVAGQGLCRATAVGMDSYASRIEGKGRAFTRVRSDVMDGINLILKRIGVLLVPVGVLTVWGASRQAGFDVTRAITSVVAPLVAMVPEGLVLLSSIAFAVSAVALARRHVLVNELPAVEGLAGTDVVCTDKTGTLTEREPAFGRVELLASDGTDEGLVRAALGALAAADPTPNETMRAIASALPAPADWAQRLSVPFSSARKWSAADFGEHGTWVLGAPEVVLEAAREAPAAHERLSDLADQGARVVALARAEGALSGERLPDGLDAVAAVTLTEQLRSDAAETVRYLGEQHVGIKIISGDNPSTVSAIAVSAGVPGAEKAVDARTLSGPAALAAAMEADAVFGRVVPDQKADMVAALQAAGHNVSMTGDGVNDVLAIKQADLGIAMGSGVSAAKAVAQIVLLDDHFSTFPFITAEGRRVVVNAERVANLFLTKSVWAALLAVLVVVLAIPYPFLPRQLTLAGSVMIGIPAFFFALGPSIRPYRSGFVPRVLRFALPAGIVIAATTLGTFLISRALGASLEEARSLTTLTLSVQGLGVIAVLEWPLTGWRLTVVALMAAGVVLIFAIPFTRDFFMLTPPSALQMLAVLAVSGLSTVSIAALTANVRASVRASDR